MTTATQRAIANIRKSAGDDASKHEQISAAQKMQAQAATAATAPTGRTDNDSCEARNEVGDMQAEAPLLSLIESDTGETGQASGNCIAFDRCPVCGHRDCFRYYPSTNTWACFGASNASGYTGGGYLEYQKVVHGMSDTEAMTELRRATGHPYDERAGKVEQVTKADHSPERKANAKTDTDSQSDFDRLDAALTHTDQLTGKNRREKPPYIVDGMISVGSVNMIAAPSKAGKSWSSVTLAYSVANGTAWMGHFACTRGRVLYVNVELTQDWLSQRLDDVRIKGKYTEGFDTLTLKGDITTDLPILRRWLAARHAGDYDLIIIDPLYLFEEGEENAAETWIPIMRDLAAMQQECGASIVYVHHFAKSWPNAMPDNRPAGSGVIGRFYDQAIMFTPRTLDADAAKELVENYGEGAKAYELYTSSRNYAEADICSVVWSWPFFHADTEHRYDSFPITGTHEAARLSGSSASAERNETLRAKQDAATTQAVEACKAAGESPTRASVYHRLKKACESQGIKYPSGETFKKWTQKGGATHWRVDQSRGNELHAVDLEQADEEGNAPFLPMPDE